MSYFLISLVIVTYFVKLLNCIFLKQVHKGQFFHIM